MTDQLASDGITGVTHAVILAGGKGTRLRPYTTRLPKPLMPIGDEYSILEIALTQLARCGFGRVTLAIGHLGELIRSYIGDGSRWGVRVDYTLPEEVPLGTMGPVLRILDQLPDQFLVMNGDVLTDLDYTDLMHQHRRSAALLTVATYQREVRLDYGVLTTCEGRVVQFTEKPTIGYRVSMGIYACSKLALACYPPGMPFGFDELVLDMLANGTPPGDYPFGGYWFDIGRPDDYDRANADFGLIRASLLREGGRPEAGNLLAGSLSSGMAAQPAEGASCARLQLHLAEGAQGPAQCDRGPRAGSRRADRRR